MQTNSDDTERLADAATTRDLHFRNLVDNALTGVMNTTLDGKITFVNRALARMVEFDSPEEMQEKGVILHWRNPERRQELIAKLKQQGYVNNYEIDLVTRTGKVIHTLVSATLQGDVISSMVTDITERKQAEEALHESEDKFRTLVTNTEEIVYMIAKDGTFLLSEGKGLSKLGLKPGQVVGESVFELYKDYPDMLDDMRRAFNGETVTKEVNVDGNYFRSWYTPHKNHEGEIIGLLGLSVNITEQKQAENKLREYQERLRSLASELTLTEERERRNIALELHDQVGQSLAVMRMQLAVAQKESEGRKVAAILDEVSGSLRQAIQDTRNVIYDLSSPLINEFGLSAALSEWLREQIGERHGLQSELRDDGEPKPLGEDTKAILYRNVRELLTNVVKHANASRVTVSLQRRGNTAQIVVEDNGIGLVEGKIPEKKAGEGGFGLFSIEERMADLGGSFEIESHPGQGVRALLTAPLEPDHVKELGKN